MTQSSPAAVKDPHKKITVTMVVGVVAGVLTGLEGFFHTGHLSSGATVAAVLGGSGLSLGTLGFGLLAHFGVTKAEIEHDAQLVQAEWVKAEPLLGTVTSAVPDLSKHVEELAAGLDQRIQDALSAVLPKPVALDVDALAAKVKDLIVGDAVKPAAAPIPPASPAPAPVAATAPTTQNQPPAAAPPA